MLVIPRNKKGRFILLQQILSYNVDLSFYSQRWTSAVGSEVGNAGVAGVRTERGAPLRLISPPNNTTCCFIIQI